MNGSTNQLYLNIEKKFNSSYNILTNNQQSYIFKTNLEKWKKEILSVIKKEIDNFNEFLLKNINKDMGKQSESNKKTVIKIESKSDLNRFTSKEIQEANKEITRNFQNEAYNYMNVNENRENENVAWFLKRVGKIARIAHVQGKKLFQIKKDEYIESNGINKDAFEKAKEKFLEEFSSWMKDKEKSNQTKETYKNILSQVNLFENEEKKNIKEYEYLTKLFYDLSILYFHCIIAFPSVEISFDKKENYNSEEMIDFINRGKNRKVNFVILPSLISNGSYLQNGKTWVFTYIKDTFKFENLNNETLDFISEKGHSNQEKEKKKKIPEFRVSCHNNFNEKIYTISCDLRSLNKEGYELIFYFLRIKDNKNISCKIREQSFSVSNNYIFRKYELIKDKKVLITRNYL